MTIYQQIIDSAKKGDFVRVSIPKRTVTIGKKKIVENGKFDGEYGIDTTSVVDTVENLFNDYCYSVPSEKSNNTIPLFKAYKLDELSVKQLAENEDRYVAQLKLDAYILGLILEGIGFDVFDNNPKHWFWQSKSNSKLIVQKNWF